MPYARAPTPGAGECRGCTPAPGVSAGERSGCTPAPGVGALRVGTVAGKPELGVCAGARLGDEVGRKKSGRFSPGLTVIESGEAPGRASAPSAPSSVGPKGSACEGGSWFGLLSASGLMEGSG